VSAYMQVLSTQQEDAETYLAVCTGRPPDFLMAVKSSPPETYSITKYRLCSSCNVVYLFEMW